MIVAHCPRCAESIRVPSTPLPDDAYVACPLCRETFSASELLDRLPPVVQVFGADGNPIDVAEQPVASFAGLPALDAEEAGLADHATTDHATTDDGAGLFSGTSGAVAAAGAVAGGAITVGASALGFGGDEEAEVEEVFDTETLEDEPSDELEDDDVQQYLDQVSEHEEEEVEAESSESTMLMDTLTNEDGGLSGRMASDGGVDVESEVQQFMADDSAVEFEPDGTEQDDLEIDVELDAGEELDENQMVVDEVDYEQEADIALNAPVETPEPVVAPMKVRTRPPARRKKASPIKTLIGVALGPLIALPLAGGILLAIGKAPNLGFWPFLGNANSKSSLVAAAPTGTIARMPSTDDDESFGQGSEMVPDDSENDEFANENVVTDSGDDGEVNEDSGFAMPANDTETPPAELAVPPVDSNVDDATSANSVLETDAPAISTPPVNDPIAKLPDAEVIPTADKEASVEMTPSEQLKQATSRDSIDAVFSMPDDEKVSSQKQAIADSFSGGADPFGEGVTLGGPAQTDSPELIEATKAASEAMVSLITKRGAGTAARSDMAKAYVEVCKAGVIESNSQSTSLRNLLTEIGQSTLLSDFEGETTRIWLDYGKRTTEGILLIGTLGGTNGTRTMSVTSERDVSVSAVEGTMLPRNGQKAIGIGKIVDKNTVVLNAVFPIN